MNYVKQSGATEYTCTLCDCSRPRADGEGGVINHLTDWHGVGYLVAIGHVERAEEDFRAQAAAAADRQEE